MPADDVPQPTEGAVQKPLLRRYTSSIDREPQQVRAAQRGHEEVVGKLRDLLSPIERDAGRCDRGGIEHDRRLHA